MTWITTISPEEAGPELRTAYEEARASYLPEYGVRVPSPAAVGDESGAAGIVASHSLIRRALRHVFSTFAALVAPDLPLTRRQQEMITTTIAI